VAARQNLGVYISAQTDYAMRALLTMAASASDRPIKADVLATAQHLPVNFLENILANLRRAGIVTSHRGNDGGYRLARPANQIAIADVMRALDGPLAEVRGLRPEALVYDGPAAHLQDVWVAVRANLREILEQVTLAHVVNGKLPARVRKLTADPDAWLPH
jgi:Rrf2 family protein